MGAELPLIDLDDKQLCDTPHWIDTRAPQEFTQGSLPGAVSLPLMNDKERHQVGRCYVQQGKVQAIELGHRLVSGEVKAQRVAAWTEYAKAHPSAYLFCWRGGLRSKITQEWIYEQSGVSVPRVKGGYKAIRQRLLRVLDEAANRPESYIVVSGPTGCGKTRVLTQLQRHLDLEGLANHRGSAFGRQVVPQPTQLNFENALALRLLSLFQSSCQFALEDESPAVGSLAIPKPFYASLRTAAHVFLEASVEERVSLTRQEYIEDTLCAYVATYGPDEGQMQWENYLTQALWRIRKRLGGLRYQQLSGAMSDALREQKLSGSTAGHEVWIRALLVDYYDPMYQYQMKSKGKTFVFRGEKEEMLHYLRQQTHEEG